MRTWTAGLIIICFVVFVPAVHADYTPKAYGGDQGETVFNKMTDWFATLGKSQEEKYIIKNKRKAARKVERAKKKIQKKKQSMAKKKKAYKK